MTRIEESVIINAPINKVFKYASNYKKWSEWFVGASSYTPTTDNEKGNGTRYEYKVKVLLFSAKVESEIHDFKENVGWKGSATKGIPHKTCWAFQSSNRLTKFTITVEAELNIPVVGTFIDKFILGPQWNRKIEKSLDNLASKFQSN